MCNENDSAKLMCLCMCVCVGLTVVTMKCLVARRRRRLAAVHLTGSSILAGLHLTAGALGRFASNGWSHAAATTQQQCLDACFADLSCVIAEWSDVFKCWLDDSVLHSPNTAEYTVFEIVRECPTTSGTSVSFLLRNYCVRANSCYDFTNSTVCAQKSVT